MSETIKISDDEFYKEIVDTSKKQTRSIGGQALHWMKIGKAVEESALFDYKRVQSALAGELSFDELSATEQDKFMDEFGGVIESGLENNFAKHLDSQEGVEVFYGIDENGDIISEKK